MSRNFIFKAASEPSEFEQIHRLNYRMFVEEIPQHPPNPDKRLVDRFHSENTYLIAMDGARLAGMLAVRGRRPFSLDGKVPGLDAHLPPGETICEIRLLGVETEFRYTGLFSSLLKFAAGHCMEKGFTLAVASGTTRQSKLYRRMGFVPFAETVGGEGARFQPMYLTLQGAGDLLGRLDRSRPRNPRHNFTPGPVAVPAKVLRRAGSPPVSHRSGEFLRLVAETKERLCRLAGGGKVELLLGSGTLANDVAAGQIRLLESPGVVLTNGEFGDRLAEHAARQGLAFDLLQAPWGSTHDYGALERLLEKGSQWVWSVHCETSTGVLNDLDRLKRACDGRARLCMDCTSSLGTVPLDLNGVYLATSVSGKGLSSLPGVSMVFYRHDAVPDVRLPRYLDLGLYAANAGVPFTHSSNLVAALHSALLRDPDERFAAVRRQYDLLRLGMETAGLPPLASEEDSSPAVLTLQIPPQVSSVHIGERLESAGYFLSFRSRYLVERNLIQICLMGEVPDEACRELTGLLPSLISPSSNGDR